ncbi:long-chain-fatty-acid--CoA ligase [Erythrobacter mangrovi]|uniref:Long-chain fatty acid--CoA ligase n=1 Tax=Erythrobacter mangrovi TaxID=2739433 RepID=A0A7D3X9D5_9SPHN|nr:long-chain fatty acid--CoA ligase [Erythrobacter mangrovi]QKG70935.1 long-chain fatty acid--CoA ligase [Erythrobacter mangrovi]
MAVNKRFPPPPSVYGHARPWNSSIKPELLHVIFARQAREVPDAPLVEFLGRSFTYRQLYSEARRFAAGLAERGISKGDRVGLFLPNVPTYVAAYYGAMMAGAVVVNFSPLYTVEELSHQVEDSGTKLLVTLDSPLLLPTATKVLDASSLQHLIVARLADSLPRLKSLALRTLGRRQLAPVPQRSDVLEWSDVLAEWNWVRWLDGKEPDLRVGTVTDLALLQYTGGTTGTPKGAMLTHGNLSSNAIQVDMLDPFDRAESDIVLGALPLFHVFANTCVLNRTVVRGGCIVMLPRFEAGQVLKTITRTQPRAFPGVPTMFQALLDHPDFTRTDWSALRVCISGGAPMPGPLREKFESSTGVRLIEGYGLTESSGVVSTNPYQGLRKPGTIGQPIPATQVLLLDKEDPESLAPDGEPGELAVRGPQVMQGYWNLPEAQATTFAEHNGEAWLRTGDVATIDDDGFLTIVDRIKDMIAVGGFKVFPSQVEAVLLEHPAIKEALVIGRPDAYRGEAPAAYVTLNEGESVSGDELKAWLNAKVGKHERVEELVVREALPKTMIGKLDRKALRAEVLG